MSGGSRRRRICRYWENSGSIDRRKIVDEKSVRHLDYKTGYLDGGYDHQQRCYAYLAVINNPAIEEVYSAVSYVRLGWWEATTYTREELLAWHADFMLRLRNGLGSFNPADHCGRCDRMHGCPGAKAYTQNSLAILNNGTVPVELTVANKATMGPVLAQHLRDVRFIEKRCKEFRAVLKLQIQKVGPIPAGIDGRVLGIVKQNRRSLDAQKAWPILAKRLTRD
ncbi:MAG: PD-(D/E)XK nuclease family protein, partial [Planctomycetes bacterium]|nr:PD-(D/E)XK nuclease family protein [Planctomycetota bacterium]